MADLDPTKFASSADVFSGNQTLPQIRAFRKSLHVQIDEKATRLRTQVGSSYRELLGTADTIVRMRGDNDDVQVLLRAMGGRCGRAVVSSKASGLAKFVARDERRDATVAARLKLLDACSLTVDRLLRGGGGLGENVQRGERLVIATKVLVLGRLLISSLGEVVDTETRRSLEMAKKTRESLRRRHRANVEKAMKQTHGKTDRDDVLNALCAYSLAASSGAKDVLRQFLHIRASAMAMALETDEDQRVTTTEDVLHGMRLYTMTLLDVQALVPTKLSQALLSLKQHELLKNAALKGLETLRLDVYEKWCGEEIQYFRPFIRHDDLDGKQAKEKLTDWARKGGQVLVKGLRRTLERMADFKSIIELRTSVLQLWIKEGGKARGFDPSEMQDELREVINSRLLAVLESKVTMLRLVGSEVKVALEGWQEGVSDKHTALWDSHGYEEALENGATSFLQEVTSRLYGRNDAVSKAVQCYNTWFKVIDDVKGVVESLRRQRWDTDFDEIEDEEIIEARQQALSKDDPKMLQDKMDAILDKTFKELERQLSGLWSEASKSSHCPTIAMFFLRILRDVRRQLPDRPSVRTFGLEMVPGLQKKAALHVAKPSVDKFVTDGLAGREVVCRPLWEGDPALPAQPSPHLMEFLQDLSLAMSEAGVDLWTPDAVAYVKVHVRERACHAWKEELSKVQSELAGTSSDAAAPSDATTSNDDDDDGNANGEDEGNSDKTEEASAPSKSTAMSAEGARNLHIQWLFDMSLLKCCLGEESPSTAEGSFSTLLEDMYKLEGLGDKALRKHISKISEEFWQRINLLFGLLA